MRQYPVSDILEELKQKLTQTNKVILQAPPGAGKSTIVPIEILNEPWLEGKKIIMLQPRRLAARSVAARMAELMIEGMRELVPDVAVKAEPALMRYWYKEAEPV